MQLVLASNSWVRNDLFKKMQLTYIKDGPDLDEAPYQESIKDPAELVVALAKAKAQKTAEKYKNQPFLIIGTDSMNLRNNMVCGKPKDKEEAFMMIKAASGNKDIQLTGWCVINALTGKEWSGKAALHFEYLPMADEAIHKYLESDDKAFLCSGGFNIHSSFHLRHCARIEGSHGNFHAIPMEEIIPILQENGFKI